MTSRLRTARPAFQTVYHNGYRCHFFDGWDQFCITDGCPAGGTLYYRLCGYWDDQTVYSDVVSVTTPGTPEDNMYTLTKTGKYNLVMKASTDKKHYGATKKATVTVKKK